MKPSTKAAKRIWAEVVDLVAHDYKQDIALAANIIDEEMTAAPSRDEQETARQRERAQSFEEQLVSLATWLRERFNVEPNTLVRDETNTLAKVVMSVVSAELRSLTAALAESRIVALEEAAQAVQYLMDCSKEEAGRQEQAGNHSGYNHRMDDFYLLRTAQNDILACITTPSEEK